MIFGMLWVLVYPAMLAAGLIGIVLFVWAAVRFWSERERDSGTDGNTVRPKSNEPSEGVNLRTISIAGAILSFFIGVYCLIYDDTTAGVVLLALCFIEVAIAIINPRRKSN